MKDTCRHQDQRLSDLELDVEGFRSEITVFYIYRFSFSFFGKIFFNLQKKSDGDKTRGQIRLVMGLSSAITYPKPNLQPLYVYFSPFSFVTSILVPVFFLCVFGLTKYTNYIRLSFLIKLSIHFKFLDS